ncbi:unnamed protein product [Schistocephalus solidus]|uniref:Sema domain-containing protein n=1 Tax=Schistocephalus solidus TaxID=70667 RepID=A0A183T9V3_SCHSO|nr:unnamed protein product [Schistocephalus solidus]
MKLTADFKLAKEDLKEPYLAPPKLLFRRFNNSAIAYLYVAAVNTIIQLDQQSLELTEIRVTGPKNFSIFRFPSLCYNYPQQNAPSLPPGYSPDNCGPRPTDVYVKAWATATAAKKSSEAFSYNEISHYDTFYPLNDDFQTMEDTLYACYNIFHGSCEGMRLTNISVTKTWNERPSDSSFFHQEFSPSIPIPVVNWNAALSATIVLDENYMYVAQEPDKIQDMTVVDIAPLAVRLRDFDYVSKQPNPESTMKFRVSDFPIQYKFSFHYTHVHVSDATKGIGSRIKQPRIYFVLQQPDNSEPKQWKTRISRICAEDTRFDSYTEITMACDGCITNEKIFNALHMATRGTVGSILAHERHSLVEDSSEAPQWSRKKQNSEDYSNVLLVAFAAQPIDRLVHSLSGTFFTQEHDFVPYLMRGTAISFYSMAEVGFCLSFFFCEICRWGIF